MAESSFQRQFWLQIGIFTAGAVLGLVWKTSKRNESEKNVQKVFDFLKAQDERDLKKMCEMVHDDMVYVNEPLSPARDIRGKENFRKAFEGSPCIWCEEANLQVLRYCCNGEVVFVERLDQFKIDGHWVRIPICGYLVVRDGKISLWKDYWDYKKYKDFVGKTFGDGFSMLKK